MKNPKKMKKMKIFTVIKKKKVKNRMIKKAVNQMERKTGIINQGHLRMDIKKASNKHLKFYFQH